MRTAAVGLAAGGITLLVLSLARGGPTEPLGGYLTAVALDVRGSIGAIGLGGPCSPGLAALIDIIEAARPAWMKDALCREHPEVSWYPERGESTAQAKAICQRCLVKDACQV